MEQVESLTIRAGRSPHPWPTKSASLQIVEFWASRATALQELPSTGWTAKKFPRSALTWNHTAVSRGRPKRLRENDDIAFIGSYVLGLGFTLAEDQKDELIAHDPRNAEVIQPYVIGKDLNQRPDCSASRWIINFRDWSLEQSRGISGLH